MLLKDIRLKALLCDVLSPSSKEGIHPRSFAFLKLVLMNKRKSFLFATLPRSGWNWTGDILSYCFVKHFTEDYRTKYSEAEQTHFFREKPVRLFSPADSRATKTKKIREIFPELDIDYCFHTHKSWKESPIWGLDDAKTILVTRNIVSTLYSFYNNRSFKFNTVQDCIDAGFLDRAINFYNSWGNFCKKHQNHKIFRFEDYKNKPEPTFSSLIKYLSGIEIEKTILKKALDYYSFDKQKEREEKYSSDKVQPFYFEGATDYSSLIPGETLDFIYKKLNNELIHKFGYEYGEELSVRRI